MPRPIRALVRAVLALPALAVILGYSATAHAATVAHTASAIHAPAVTKIGPKCIINPATGQCYVPPPPPCYGSSCVGKNPQTLGCAGSNALDEGTVGAIGGGASVTLRYSPWCGAKWARLNGASYWPPGWFVETSDGVKAYGGGALTYTEMLNGTEKAKACIQSEANGGLNCTPWF